MRSPHPEAPILAKLISRFLRPVRQESLAFDLDSWCRHGGLVLDRFVAEPLDI
jgi:hypothetical protein